MSGRLIVLGFAAALLLAAPARAEPPFEIGFLKLGMPLAQLRAEAWPAETKLLCSTDDDLPALDDDSRRAITLGPAATGAGIIPCALFGRDKDGSWRQRPIMVGGHPAGFWAMAIVQDSGGPPVVAEAQIRQAKEFFTDTVAYLTERAGPPKDANKYAAHWLSPTAELTVAHASSDAIITFLIDNQLHAVAKARLTKPSKKNPPKDHVQ